RQSWLQELAGVLSPREQEQIMAALQILISKTNIPAADGSLSEFGCTYSEPGSNSASPASD
ncbi:MAG: hypothetical protein JW862_00575, partial [Anaerolineales bacterium]|nr:hypothetical protein [Anaerolineales bacterium]